MIHWVRFFARLSTAAYALKRSWVHPLFFLYFCAQIGDTVAEESMFWAFGDDSPVYFCTYTVGTALICLFVLWLTWDSIPSPHRLRKAAIPAVLGVTVARMTALEHIGGINSSDWLILAVGAFLFACGTILTTAAVYAPRNHTALLILGILWLVQAVYFFGYLIQAPEWIETGYWAPALITALGFLAVGRMLPQPSASQFHRVLERR